MGWFWKNNEDDHLSSGDSNPRSGESCSTRKIVKSLCAEPRRPSPEGLSKNARKRKRFSEIVLEVVQSNRHYMEDVTDKVLIEGITENVFEGSVTFDSSDGMFVLPGDTDAVQKSLFDGFDHFFDAFAKDPLRHDAPKPKELESLGDD